MNNAFKTVVTIMRCYKNFALEASPLIYPFKLSKIPLSYKIPTLSFLPHVRTPPPPTPQLFALLALH
jgi:hypothetical protein